MQDRYFGDVGDFGKYGLLRALCGVKPHAEALRLGIIWYLVGDESHNADGKHIAYLERGDYRECDPDLFDTMKATLSLGRAVSQLPSTGLFPADATYFADRVELAHLHHADRAERRASWFRAALAATQAAELVFCDPDNGIATDAKLLSSHGDKFVGLTELASLHARGQSVVAYHHADRSAVVPVQAQRRADQLRNATTAEEILCLRYRRGTTRLFFILPTADHVKLLRSRVQCFLESSWGQHYDLVAV